MTNRFQWRRLAGLPLVALLAAPAPGQGAGIITPAPEYKTAPITDPKVEGAPPAIVQPRPGEPAQERFAGDDRARVVGEMRSSLGIWRQRVERMEREGAPAADRMRAAVADAERHLQAAVAADGPQWTVARDAFRLVHDDLAGIWNEARMPG